MSKLKQKKYVALLGILILVIGIIGLITYGRVDKYKGLIKIKEAKVLSSVGNTSFVMSKGTEEVEYEMEYTLDEIEGVEKRDVIIEGKINNEYATFKEIEGRNITSTLKENGKEIEIEIKDVRLGEEQRITIKVQVTNAPNKEEIIPEIKIKETTGEYTRVNTEAIKVETNSVEGIVYDENKVPVTDIELSINKNGREIKRTYTKEDGRFIFSDLEEGEYEIKVEEEVYELEGNGRTREENERLELRVKEVDKFNIETHKYIEKLRLVVNGKEENYTYKDAEKVIENVKNAKSISGEIEYRITVENKGEKETVVERVIDEPGEGLEFKASKNTGWEEEEGILKYKPIEGSSLKGKEKREIKLVLSITKTNEIKEYINKLNTKGEIKEKVVYVIDGKIVREESVIEGERIEKPNFGIENLDGWYTDTNYTNKYKFSKEVNKDIILYAKTKEEKNKYQVRYIDEGNIVKEEEIEEGNKTVAPEEPSKRGYTFKCWTLENNCYDFEEEVNKDIDLISSYEPIKYTITYDLDGGSLEEGKRNPKEYTIETESFTLNNPNKRGYTFIGWTGSNGNEPSDVTIEKGSTGDKEYTANYEINDYKLEIDPKGGEYSGELLVNGNYGTIVTITEPSKTGYTFTGWTLTGRGIYNNNLYTFEEGNGKLEANYTPIEYTITYKGITEEEKRALNNPETYTIETNLFTLNNPSNRLNEDNEGEVFVGWKEKESDTPSMSISLPDVNNLGNKEYTAIFNEREADKWNITYELKGGEVSGNPSTYKRSELPITLNNPEKEGYTFIGWTGSNGREPSNVTIPKNTTGDLNYEANYTPKEYTITYDLDGGSVSTPNKETYTIETETFSLNNPSKEGYTFEGWIGSNGTTPQTNVSIAKGSTGNKNYEAKYTINKYNVEFYNMNSNGEYTLNKTVEDIDYNTVIPSNEVPEVSLRGYTFKYWSLDKTNEYDLSTKVTNNIKLYAVYTKDIYTITYDIDGGSLEEGKTNPSTYQVDTERFTLNNPRKAGHEFKGWTGSNGNVPEIEVTLPDNKIENKNYKANYEINKYTVTYMNGNEKFYEEEVEYNKTAKGTTTNPRKAHNIFLKWVKEDGTEYDFNTPVINNMTLYASYEEVEAPKIKHTPTEWTRNNVEVTITSDHTDYEYMYKVGNGEYKKYTGAFEVEENSTIYAYSIKNEITSVEVTHDITNIDKINPSINSFETTQDPTSITVNIKGQDNQSGTAYIKVYLNNENVFSTDEYTGNDTSEKIETYTISNLEQLTTYTVKVEVIDKVGNSTIEEKEVTTSEKHYVARIIGTNNTLFEDESLYINLESLEEGIKYNKNGINCIEKQCTIQMLDNVEETNSVLEGQDITLDLNGKVITGLQEKAFENNGNLQIVDHNEEEIGKITSEGIGIINNGKLIVGENEEELVVSKDEPVIEGSVTGVNSPGELHFYDGKIIGGSTTGALKGSAPITPYSYNASVETTGGKEIATLEIIADAEARINSVYYTKVQSAVDESKNGTIDSADMTRNLLLQTMSEDEYRFIYDESTKSLVNSNKYINNSVAHSYIILDLTNYEQDQLLTMETEIKSQSGYDIGYATVTESEEMPAYNETEGRFIYVSGNRTDRYSKVLEKGKKYYLHLGYYKNQSDNTVEDMFKINNINLGDYVTSDLTDLGNAVFLTNSSYYFKKQEDGSFKNSNSHVANSIADSYLVFDLTNVDKEKYLLATTKISSQSGYDFGYITVTNSSSVPSSNDTNGRNVYISGEEKETTYPIKLLPNQVNFVHFCYSKNNSNDTGEDSFTIISLKSSEDNISKTTDSIMHSNGDYYFEELNYEPTIWADSSGNNNDGTLYNVTSNEGNTGYVFNGTNSYVSIGQINPDMLTVQASFEIDKYQSQIVIGNYEAGGYAIYVNASKQLVGGVYVGTGYKEVKMNGVQLNTRYNVTLTYNQSEVIMYVNGVKQTPIAITDDNKSIVPPTKNTYLMLGTNPVRNEPFSQYFSGTIYDIKVYSRPLSSDEVINNSASNDNLLIHLDGSNSHRMFDNTKYRSNNQNIDNTTANSYMIFDLTDFAEDKYIIINAEISSEQNRDYGYITVTDDENAPAYNYSSGRYVYVSGVSSSDYKVKLIAGKKNYVHFGYYKNGSNRSNLDSFIINSIRYYDESETGLPTYIIENSQDSNTIKDFPIINLNSEPDNIQIIRNITMTKPLEIVETRDAILDLNGYTLTSNKEDYVIKNSGSLKIVDSAFSDPLAEINQTYNREQSLYDEEYNSKMNLIEEQNDSIKSDGYFEILKERIDKEYNSNLNKKIKDNEVYSSIKEVDYNIFENISVNRGSGSSASSNANASNKTLSLSVWNGIYGASYYQKSYTGKTRVYGNCSTSNNSGRSNTGVLYIGFATTPEATIDDYIDYKTVNVNSSSSNTFDITVNDNSNYYFKVILSNTYGWTNYASLSNIFIENEYISKSYNKSGEDNNLKKLFLSENEDVYTFNSNNDFIKIDLDNSKTITSYNVELTEDNKPFKIELYGSDDNNSFDIIETTNISDEESIDVNLDKKDSYKYYKWVFYGNDGFINIKRIIPTIYDIEHVKINPELNINSYVSNGLIVRLNANQYGNNENVWKDLSGNGNDFIVQNGIFKNGKLSLSGNESSAYSKKELNISSNSTFEISFNSKSNGTILDARNDSKGYRPIYLNGSFSQTYSSKDDAINKNIIFDYRNSIHTFTVVYTEEGSKLYIDGNKISESELAKGFDYLSNIFIGKDFNYSNFINSDIYSFRYYNRVLSDSEIVKNSTLDKVNVYLTSTRFGTDDIYNISDYVDNAILHYDGKNKGNVDGTIKDITENNNNGSLNNVESKEDYLLFSGNGSITTNNSISINTEETVEVLVNPSNSNNSVIYSGSQNEKISLGVYNGYLIATNQESRYQTFELPTNYSDGSIKSLVVTYKDNNYEIYYNGYKLNKRSNTDYWGANENTYIGQDSSGNNKFSGKIYSVRIYNKALSDAEVIKNYNVDTLRYNLDNKIIKQEATRIIPEQAGNITSTTGSVILNNYDAYLEISEGIINLNKSGSIDVITNKGDLLLGEYAHVNALQSSNIGINNTISGVILQGLGNVTTNSSSNIGILNDGVNQEKISGIKVSNASTSSYNLYNRSINDLELNNVTFKGAGVDIYQNTNNNLLINKSNLESSSNESFYSDQSSTESEITFKNSIIKNRIYNRSGSKRKIFVDNCTMTGSRENIYNYEGTVDIKNSNLTNSSWNVENYGTLSIEDSILNADYNSIANGWSSRKLGKATFNDTIINTKGTSNENVVYNYDTMSISGGSINNKVANSTAIYNAENCTLNIRNSFVTNDRFSTGIYNVGILNLGNNDDEVSTNEPIIRATGNSIYSHTNGTFNYYDGKLIGVKNNALYGKVANIPEHYDINVTKGDQLETIVLKDENSASSNEDYVAAIGDTKYTTIQKAVDSVSTSDPTEIILLKDVETARTVTIPNLKNITLNQKNYSIKTHTDERYFENNGELTFKDDSEEITSYNSSYSNKFIINNGTLNYNDIKTTALDNKLVLENNATEYEEDGVTKYKLARLNINSGEMNSDRVMVIDNHGYIDMKNGIVRTTIGNTPEISQRISTHLIENRVTGEIHISGGTLRVSGYDQTTNVNNAGKLYITGGRFKTEGAYYHGCCSYEGDALKNLSTGYLEITGGDFSSDTNLGNVVRNGGEAHISNITTPYQRITTNTGTMTITDVTGTSLRSNTGYPIDNRGSGKLTVTGGNYTTNSTLLYSSDTSETTFNNVTGTHTGANWMVSLDNSSVFTMNGGSLTRSNTGNANNNLMAVNHTAKFEMNSGEIIDKVGNGYSALYIPTTNEVKIKSGEINSRTGNGIYKTTTGTVIFGTKILPEDDPVVVSKEDPKITGGSYGLYTSNADADIQFYDGIFTGAKEKAIFGSIGTIEDGYDIIKEENDDKESKYLDRKPLVKNITKIESLDENPSEEEIKQFEYYTLQEAIDAASDGDKLELMREYTSLPDTELVTNDKIITIDFKGYKMIANNDKFILNNGELSFVNSSEDRNGSIETNKGTIIENNGTFKTNNVDLYTTLSNVGNLIINNATEYEEDGEVKYKLAKLYINGGNIYTERKNVIDNSGYIEITGGTIKTTKPNTPEIGEGVNTHLIENRVTGEIHISGGTLRVSGYDQTTNVNNAGKLYITGGRFKTEGAYYHGCCSYEGDALKNLSSGYLEITGGDFSSDTNLGNVVRNNGEAHISNITTPYQRITTNTGTMTITDVTGTSLRSNTGYPIDNRGSGKLTVTGGNYTTNSTLLYSSDTSETTFNNVTGTHTGANWMVSLDNSSVFTMNGGSLTRSNTGNANNNLMAVNHTAKFEMNGGEIIDKVGNGYSALYIPTTNEVKIKSGEINSRTGNGIYKTTTGTVIFGTKILPEDDPVVVSKEDPKITGGSYGLYTSNADADIQFYDGIFTGAKEKAIFGSIGTIEEGYSITPSETEDTQSKYLSKTYLLKNNRLDKSYYSFEDALSDNEMLNEDTFTLLRDYTTLSNTETIEVSDDKKFTLDMNGKKIAVNNNKFLINYGDISLTNSSENSGSLESSLGTIIENNGTFKTNNVDLYTTLSNVGNLIINNATEYEEDGEIKYKLAKLYINGGNIYTERKNVIDNSGYIEITGGTIKTTKPNTPEIGEGVNTHLIENRVTGEIHISGGTLRVSGYDQTTNVNNAGKLYITGGRFKTEGAYYHGCCSYEGDALKNLSSGYLEITGGDFSSDTNLGNVVRNNGEAHISNITTPYQRITTNTGTMTITDVTGTSLVRNTGVPIDNQGNGNLTITGGSYTSSNMLFASSNNSNMIINNSNMILTGANNFASLSDSSRITINGGTFERSNTGTISRNGYMIYVNNSSILTLNNTNITDKLSGWAALYMTSSNELLINNSSIISNYKDIQHEGAGSVNINSGTLTSNNDISIYMNGRGTLNIGTQGGIPSVTNPIISGKTYGLYNNAGKNANIYFYDGIIKGETGSIYGTITDTEAGYKEKRDNVTDPDTGVTTIDSTLTVVGETERIAVVNNINFLSLQAAVNYASNNNIENIQLYKSITLEDNIVKPESGSNVKIYLGGNTITEGSYTIGEGIELVEGTAPSASISRFLASITGTEINPRNIIIFEMSDGSKLEANVTYKLYKLTDNGYKIVKLKENELGDYDIGSTVEKMNTARGKLYINQIGEGKYKLVGTDDKEVNFEITSEGISNNIRINNGVRKNRIVETIATLILSLQTGVVRNPYVLMIMILIVIILSFIAYKKYKEGYEN